MNNQTSKDSILIVDDEKSILDVLISGLSDDGFKCFAAFNANEALDIVKREKIDFSLLDIRLPAICQGLIAKVFRHLKLKTKFCPD